MNKTAVITGGNSGVGRATAKALAKKGYRVIIHGRDAKKTSEAVAEIIAASGNRNVEGIAGDVSTVEGIKKLAADISEKTTVIDSLILSTGVIYSKQVITKDGLDYPFVTQYLSRFGLVQLLKPLLEKSADARIVHMGAPTMKKAKIHFDNLALKNEFSMLTSMGQAMLSDHLFVQEFAKRNPSSKIRMNIFHVGIAKTGIARDTNFFFRTFVNVFGVSPEKACANAVFLADDSSADFSGYFLPAPGKPVKREKIAFDSSLAERLWTVSERLISG